ncbi:MAG: SUMF1/EgtB/PvdO family nonheme iron enzyme [Myxococcales bacterium]|nr:SUMF1/EgtB/PvdO family nonheme iron enzyme [Myxococcales bacterium]
MRLWVFGAVAGSLLGFMACSSSTTNEGTTGGTGGASTGGSSGGGAGGGGGSAGAPSGGGGPSGGAAGSGGGTDAGFSCPAGKKGPDLVPVAESFCVDATEVTSGQYSAFLADVGAADAGPTDLTNLTACATLTDYNPKNWGGCPAFSPGADQDFPIRCVDWCSAYAYCRWAGKRLCGKIPSGPVSPSGAATQENQWYTACAGPAGADKYSYGDSYEPGRCVDDTLTAVQPVASHPNCTSFTTGKLAFDLIGNVSEWEDACDKPQDADANCNHRGGSVFTADVGMTCAAAAPLLRSLGGPDIGFRCCWDASVN